MSPFTHSLQVLLFLPLYLTPATCTFLHAYTQSFTFLRSRCPNHLNLPHLLCTFLLIPHTRKLWIQTATSTLFFSAHSSAFLQTAQLLLSYNEWMNRWFMIQLIFVQIRFSSSWVLHPGCWCVTIRSTADTSRCGRKEFSKAGRNVGAKWNTTASCTIIKTKRFAPYENSNIRSEKDIIWIEFLAGSLDQTKMLMYNVHKFFNMYINMYIVHIEKFMSIRAIIIITIYFENVSQLLSGSCLSWVLEWVFGDRMILAATSCWLR